MSPATTTAPSTDIPLREGFTTGTAAAAAAKAAALLLQGGTRCDCCRVPLPMGGRLEIRIEQLLFSKDGAQASVIKDGGDDPDATHGARIWAQVILTSGNPGIINVDGGPGVGRVTLPGLPRKPGEAAINPAPLQQIQDSVREIFTLSGYPGGADVLISVENGEEIARRTMNPRLGIVGGISILGTSGIVRPFSHEAWQASIAEAMDVARALALPTVCLATGRRSERLLQSLHPELSEHCFIQSADFFAFSLQQAAARGFQRVILACYPGKLVKMAQGLAYTHAKSAPVDGELLASWCAAAGADSALVREAEQAVTVRRVAELLGNGPLATRVWQQALEMALVHARAFLGPGPHLEIVVFDFDGALLIRSATQPSVR